MEGFTAAAYVFGKIDPIASRHPCTDRRKVWHSIIDRRRKEGASLVIYYLEEHYWGRLDFLYVFEDSVAHIVVLLVQHIRLSG